mgnify:CR=1 FL=1
MRETILILDFGSQYTQLIARRTREVGVYSEIVPCTAGIDKVKEIAPKGIILSGSPFSAYAADAPTLSEEIFNLGIPVLGVCYGMQLMSLMFGGAVEPAETRGYGRSFIKISDQKGLFRGCSSDLEVWMSHGDHVTKVPEGFVQPASAVDAPLSLIPI